MADTTTTPSTAAKLTFATMTTMVVGSMVGAGVFSLPSRFAQQTGIAGALIAWTIAGTGMLMLAFVFQTLALRKPELDAGVYAYAKAGFGEYLGFFSIAVATMGAMFGAKFIHLYVTQFLIRGPDVPALRFVAEVIEEHTQRRPPIDALGLLLLLAFALWLVWRPRPLLASEEGGVA